MSTAKRKLRLVKLKKYNTIWHPDSTLVFKSQKERLVIGRLVDKELVPLDDEAIELAEQWKLKIDESLIESGSDSEEKDSEEKDSEEKDSEDDNSEDDNSEEESPDNSDEESPDNSDGSNDENSKEESPVDVSQLQAVEKRLEDIREISNEQSEDDSLQLKEPTDEKVESTKIVLKVNTSDNELTKEIMQNARKTVDLIIELETKLDTVCKEKETLQLSYDELKAKYDSIMHKFNTMKSLFN
jgi:hypothetical protein